MKAPWPIFAPRHSISSHGASDDAFAVAKTYLFDCLTSHSVCKSNSTRQLPKRLIDVGSFSGAHPFLTECSEQAYRYLALSYCWGEEQRVTTTLQSFEEKQRKIDLSSLPRTLRDAVQIARQMQVQYLWVDSLCIIQDDENDWAVESSHMRSIYQNALFTICADAAPNVHSGIFSLHSLARQSSSLVRGPDGQQHTISIRNSKSFCKPGVTLDDSDTGNPNVQVYPLTRRAWALQERVLSTRILHFNEREISWECKEAFRCECQEPTQTKNRGDLASLQIFGALYEHWDLLGFTQAWQKIVGSYTTRELTRDMDRLPALSGIARLVQELLLRHDVDNTYLAGLWRFNLAQDLTWHQSLWRSTLKRPPSYRAPSWSWASVEGRISFSYGVRSKLQIINSYCAPAGPDPTGKITGGSLSLRGLCIPIEMRIRPAGLLPCKNENGEATSYYCEERYVIRNQTLARSMQIQDHQAHRENLSEADKDFLDAIEGGTAYGNHDFFLDDNGYEPPQFVDKGYKCLLVGESTSGNVRTATGLQYGKLISHWLILKPSDRVSGTYERLGYISSNEVFRCYLREGARDHVIGLV